MINKIKGDPAWAGSIILLYTGPFFCWLFIATNTLGFSTAWPLFSAGLLMVLSGSLALILLQPKQKASPVTQPSEPVSAHSSLIDSEAVELRRQLNEKLEEASKQQEEVVSLKNQHFQTLNSYNALKEEMEALRMRQKDSQSDLSKQYQEKIFDLENQVEDLKYELRSILNLNTAELASIEESES